MVAGGGGVLLSPPVDVVASVPVVAPSFELFGMSTPAPRLILPIKNPMINPSKKMVAIIQGLVLLFISAIKEMKCYS